MFYKEYTRELDPEVFPENPGQITVYANHYANKVIVQLRVNGELDSTYEVRAKGLGHEETGFAFEQNTEDDEDYAPIRDPLSNYDVSTRLGDSNNMKMPIICTQIVELYQRVILPKLSGGVDVAVNGNTDFVLTLSTRLWRKSDENDFGKLLFLLQTIKEAYSN